MRWTRIVPVLMLAMFLGGPGRVAAQGTTLIGHVWQPHDRAAESVRAQAAPSAATVR